MSPVRRAALLLLAVLLVGCGYSLRSTLPPHIKTVAIPVLTNRTPEPGIEDLITQALIDAMVSSGRMRVVRPEQADALLEGEVIGYAVDALAFNRAANVTEYRLRIALKLTLRDLRQNTILWQEERVEEKADFRVPGQVTEALVREDQALRRAAVDIARAVIGLAVEGF